MTDKLNAVLTTRKSTHGDFKDQFACAQELKNVLKRYQSANPHLMSSVAAEALDQICHKVSRIATGDPSYADHWRDIGGYATLIADMLDSTPETPPAHMVPAQVAHILGKVPQQYADPHTSAAQRAAEKRIDVV